MIPIAMQEILPGTQTHNKNKKMTNKYLRKYALVNTRKYFSARIFNFYTF